MLQRAEGRDFRGRNLVGDCAFEQQVFLERFVSAPCRHGCALDGFVSGFALQSALGELQQDGLRVVEPFGDFQIPLHVLRIDDEPVHELLQRDEHRIHQDAGVGENDALHRAVADVAFVPERHVFQRSDCVASDESGLSAELFAGDGVALVRHRAAAFLSFGKILLHFEHLGALEMAELRRPAVHAGCDDCEHRVKLGMTIALHDLCRERRSL